MTIVIPVFGQSQVTERCLNALASTEACDRSSVIVVNDASPDETLDVVARFPWVSVEDLPENVGFPQACNAGAARAQTEFVHFLNNDTEPLPGFLDALIALADSDPSIAIVGSRLVYPDGRLQEAGGIVWADAKATNYGRGRSPDEPEFLYVRDVDYCSAASILVRTDFFNQVGGFDRRYTRGYYEDTDLAFAARAHSRRVVYQPKSVVIHEEGATSGTDVTVGVKRYQEINRRIFAAKWAVELRAQPDATDMAVRIAADRSAGRSILFIDYQMLTPNHDSGSRRSWEILQICRNQGYRIIFAAESGDEFSPAMDALRQLGTMVIGGRWRIRSFLREEGDRLSCVFIARVGVARRWSGWLRFHLPNVPIVFDTVDIHHIREALEARLTGSRLDSWRARRTRTAELDLVRRSTATVVVSESERRYLSEVVPDGAVFTVGNIHRPATYIPGFDARSGLVFVGSFLHSPNADGIRWFLREIWPLLDPAVRGAGLQILGQEPPEDLTSTSAHGVVVHGWVPDIAPFLLRARVAIAPLRFGAGIKGKIGEAWAHGLPVVGTTIALDSMVEPDDRAYVVADDPPGFARLIERLHGSPDAWSEASLAGREAVQSRLSPERAGQALQDLLTKTLSGSPSHSHDS